MEVQSHSDATHKHSLDVKFKGVTVHDGDKLTMKQVRKKPTISWDAKEGKYVFKIEE